MSNFIIEEVLVKGVISLKSIINKLVNGESGIYFSIRGSADPMYWPCIRHLIPEEKESDYFFEKEILTEAIKECVDGNIYFSDPFEFLESALKKRITKASNLPNGFDFEYNKKIQDLLYYTSDTVTGFKIKLSDLLREVRETESKRKEREKATLEFEATMRVEILKRGISDDEDRDSYAEVKITDVKTGEQAEFTCRNIFDFGYVVNPAYSIAEGYDPGGFEDKGFWMHNQGGKGFSKIRELTDFEKKALKYLETFSPISADLRM